jgi:hypothetical protein
VGKRQPLGARKMANGKHYSGQSCPQTGTYGQYHDTNNGYAGSQHDRHVKQGDTFPPSINNYHFKLK